MAHVQTKEDAVGAVDWELSIDSTVVRAHQAAAGARRRPSQADQQEDSWHVGYLAVGAAVWAAIVMIPWAAVSAST